MGSQESGVQDHRLVKSKNTQLCCPLRAGRWQGAGAAGQGQRGPHLVKAATFTLPRPGVLTGPAPRTTPLTQAVMGCLIV